MLDVTGVGGVGAGASSATESKSLVRKQLERLGKFLKYLAGKADTSLFGSTGIIVIIFLMVAAKMVEVVAQHLYIAVAGGGICCWVNE